MKFSKLAAAAAGAGVALSATVVGLASPAMASQTCSTWKSKDGTTGYAKCTGGDTRFSVHRVHVVCVDPRGIKWNSEGNWANTRKGETSKAVCAVDHGYSGTGVLSMSVETDEPV
ncbi:hypothetical protein A6P39_017675 [Streptomyces sp. FXJ1.172]|uniref:hypothetical protein n=1 Tax=Streptomyces sp. FXJ1.172 TaxID=710705 RepID=UPI0007CF02FF|nr:hypothetical protein [Streptomyces sp. FXJ1.172]WEO95711.1 hypothetical protein A6P39_017675 [Streptomyces sp. FXJ1.172]